MVLFHYLQIVCCLLMVNFPTSTYASSAEEDDIDPSKCFRLFLPILKFFPCTRSDYTLIPNMEKQDRKKTAKKTLAFSNGLQRLSDDVIFYMIEFSTPQDILSLFQVDKFFKGKITDSFWEKYGNKRNYKKWSADIYWSKVVFANTWYVHGSQKLTEKAAKLGHPQAKEKLRALEEETRRIEKQNSEQSSNYNPDYHRFSLTHKHPRMGYGYSAFSGPGYRPGNLSYYAHTYTYG